MVSAAPVAERRPVWIEPLKAGPLTIVGEHDQLAARLSQSAVQCTAISRLLLLVIDEQQPVEGARCNSLVSVGAMIDDEDQFPRQDRRYAALWYRIERDREPAAAVPGRDSHRRVVHAALSAMDDASVPDSTGGTMPDNP
jgi:hypothetical protein